VTDKSIQVHPDTPGLGKKIDLEELLVGIDTVYRQRVQIAGASALQIAGVINTVPGASDYGIVSRILPGAGAAQLGKALQTGTYASGDIGVLLAGVRNDALTTINSTNLNYGTIAVDNAGRQWICGSTIDGSAYSPGSNKIIQVGAAFDDAAPTAAGEDVIRTLRMSANRNLYTMIRDGLGNERGVAVNASNQLSTIADGTVAHGATDAGNPLKLGGRAVAHGTNPTAVAAGQRSDALLNRAGIPFSIPGHPNMVTVEAAYTAAQTDTALVTVAAGLKIIVTNIMAACDNGNTVKVGLRVGFGAVNTPTTTGVVLSHPGIAPGGAVIRGGNGILGIGADGEDLRVTSDAPTTGSLRVLVSYFTIES
jgi:hypothetical protein